MAELSPQSSAEEIVAHLRSIGSEKNRLGMLRYGIKIERALGISHGVQRQIAKKIKRNHERAFELWQTGIMEAQFIASVTADPERFSAADARRWAASFDSWDIVDGVSDLFVDTDSWRELIDEFAADKRGRNKSCAESCAKVERRVNARMFAVDTPFASCTVRPLWTEAWPLPFWSGVESGPTSASQRTRAKDVIRHSGR